MAAVARPGVAAATQENMLSVFGRLVLMDVTMNEFKEENEEQTVKHESYPDIATPTLRQQINDFNQEKEK